MTNNNDRAVNRAAWRAGRPGLLFWAIIFVLGISLAITPHRALAQEYRFSSFDLRGNQRVDDATILSYAGIAPGQAVSAAQLNEAYQKIVDSGLFEEVAITPQGGTLVISVTEYPTINVISFEGNSRIKDDILSGLIRSQSRRVYSPRQAESDAAAIIEAYSQQGRLAANVTPRIIRRSDNRVDLVFEIAEGGVIEVQRISFVGNRSFSDYRLRRALGTKQAGLLHNLIRSDTYVADRIAFDRQALSDFYMSRGFIDFQVLSVTSALTRKRDAFLITFNLREGQQFRFGKISASSSLPEVDAAEFQSVIKLRPGIVYSPVLIESTIERLERLALQKGLTFVRAEPRVTRNERDQTLDIDFAIIRGPRIFVERIDIEGNATTLDQVIRRQFNTVEGDPFNPREIRDSARRIRALGFFETANVDTRAGTSPDRVIVDVNVQEKPTGSLSFGVNYSATNGAGGVISFAETNFLGRGQGLNLAFDTGLDSSQSSFSFTEPAFLGRNVRFRFSAAYEQSDELNNALYRTRNLRLGVGLEFPVSENGRLEARYTISEDNIFQYTGTSTIITAEAAQGALTTSKLGYSYSYDTRKTGLNPNAGVLLRIGQDYAGLGGDSEYIETTALIAGVTTMRNEDVELRAELEGGYISMLSGNSRVTNRYFGNGKIRGFDGNGLGPRDPAVPGGEALGGNAFAVARLEAAFPLGLPQEYGIRGGVFADVGSVWSLDNTNGGAVDDSLKLRSAIGVSLFWDSVLGPLRFNFSRAIKKESYDNTRSFDLTFSTRF